jgi:hypothetical protein
MVFDWGWSVALRSPKGGAFRAKRKLQLNWGAYAASAPVPFFLLSLFHRPAESIGVTAGFDNVCPIRDAVQERFTESRVRYHLRPFREG